MCTKLREYRTPKRWQILLQKYNFLLSISASDDARGAETFRLSEVRRRVHPRAPTGDAHEASLKEGEAFLPSPSLLPSIQLITNIVTVIEGAKDAS